VPTLITHGFVSVAMGNAVARRPMPRGFWPLLIALSLLPDVDVVAFRLGIPYGSFWGHRGISHSLAFAIVVSFVAAMAGYRFFRSRFRSRWRLWGLFAVVMLFHPLADAATNGGLGCALLGPFDNTRYFLPWRPIEVSPIGIRNFLTPRGLEVLASEALWVWLPLGALAATCRIVLEFTRRRRQRRHHAPPEHV
jgi:inner membrane protein